MSTSISAKFEQELSKFFKFAKSENLKIDNGDIEWGVNLVKGYEEPGRNKLEKWIKALCTTYTIAKDEHIEDYKEIMAMYKNKPKKTKNTKTKNTKPKNTEDTEPSDTEEVEDVETEDVEDVIIDNNIDTSETYYLETLENDTMQLLKKLGKPIKNETEKNRFEWKLKINDAIYTIYDWLNEDGEFENFEECYWHLGGTDENEKNIRLIKTFLNESKTKKAKEKKSKEKPSSSKIQKTMGELFGEDTDEEDSYDIGEIGDDELLEEINLDELM